MKRRDPRRPPGQGDLFATTQWTKILNVRNGDEHHRRQALNELATGYWWPVFCYISRKGYPDEVAEDLTQGFFEEVVLGRQLIQQAERSKGRFRTFLLTALNRFLASKYRAQKAQKRTPAGGIVHEKTARWQNLPERSKINDPKEAFNHAWATALLDRVLSELRGDCFRTGKTLHWSLFEAKVLRPIMESSPSPPLAKLCQAYGIEDAAKASNMIVTVKRRFQFFLRKCVRHFVGSDEDIDEEIGDMVQILSQERAR